MNLIEDGAAAVAMKARLRVIAKGLHRVYVRPTEVIAILPPTDPRADMRPDADLVGSYNRRAKLEDIEADLVERLSEIAPCCEGSR